MENFSEKLENNIYIKDQEKKFLLFFLKFMFDFDLKHEEFLELTPNYQDSFIKFVSCRFFKDKIRNSGDYHDYYHDISVYSDSFSTFSEINNHKSNFSISPIKSELKISKSLSNCNGRKTSIPKQRIQIYTNTNPPNPKSEKGTVKIKILDSRKDIVEQVRPSFFVDSLLQSKNAKFDLKNIILKMPKISIEDLQKKSFKIGLLQDYLRKKERLNLICRRKKSMHQKTKRNDEKTKKIFKKAIKNLLKIFEKSNSYIK